MQACTPLQSLPWTGVRVNYNRALLETLSGNFEKASEHLKQVNLVEGSINTSKPLLL